MTMQIAVRLPEETVAYLDGLVRSGAGSRAAIVNRALGLLQQQLRAEHDAKILEETGDYEEFDGLAQHVAIDD
jgi:Arc/MetJ-type ribon-helix-helix transcriptional regulator